MDRNMIAYCGTYCGDCEWREKIDCKGCKANAGKMFWGECDKAMCCIGKGYSHCGECEELPCRTLKDLFNDPEHGDSGERLNNLKNWKEGKYDYKKLQNAAQEKAKKM